MKRWPIRARLAAAYALALLAVLACVALVAYTQVRTQLDDSLNASLRARADALATLAGQGDSPVALSRGALEADESFAQVISPSGRLLGSAGGPRTAVLPVRLGRSRTEPVSFEASVDGIEGTARVLARAASPRAGAPLVVVGQSLDDRDETLAGLLVTFAVGSPVAAAVASAVGYLLAGAGLAPVEAMRRRASAVSLDSGEALPLPEADDEIRRLGETLNGMLARLRASFERERRFVADASHELRTPVAVLKAEIEAALSAAEYGPDVGDSLKVALEECDQMSQLIEDLLVIARAGEQGLPVRREQITAAELLAGVRDRFELRARQLERAITIEAVGDLEVSVDPHRMRQALGNLVDNGLRHGAGTVVLSARRVDRGVELAVVDAGAGFTPGLADRAFDRFSRGEAARTGVGAGLGLAIVRAIAQAHGGEAQISPDDPSCVRICVPA